MEVWDGGGGGGGCEIGDRGGWVWVSGKGELSELASERASE